MKPFKKDNNEFLICEECWKQCGNLRALSQHLNAYHNLQEYYDKWIKEKKEGICEICGQKTIFVSIKFGGYRRTCSKECHDKLNSKIQNSQDQIKKDKKRKKTCNKKYGVSNVSKVNKIKSKKEETCLRNYGVLHPTQNLQIFDKARVSSLQIKKFRNTSITYQGSYELDFLEKYYNKWSDIINAPSIKYKFNYRDRIYHPDFYIPSLNLIIECKNKYLLKRDRDLIEAKEKATIDNGFKYIMIIDKDYSEFL